MGKKFIFVFSLMLFYQSCFAENCPNVQDIKTRTLIGWKIYDSEEGTPLSSKREIQFKNTIEQFALAEWRSENNHKGTIHCYYRDNTGSDLEAYIAKDHFAPNNYKKYWYDVSGFMHCAAGIHQCEFVANRQLPKQQLAKR